ncbi:hypothetical protein EB796_023598 [Bugula neritina]|uniref:Uncharacterized protein n=1 Tax=Bugula neritina TaxID=10212 RepID=A0A7J7IXH3_BUGNE|nr:hypothetical protein EB796_023598 [Bugula neritina]
MPNLLGNPKSAIRLRTSRPVDPNRPRPIKVEFTSETSKWEFIKRANASLRSLNVFVKPDESKKKEKNNMHYVSKLEI